MLVEGKRLCRADVMSVTRTPWWYHQRVDFLMQLKVGSTLLTIIDLLLSVLFFIVNVVSCFMPCISCKFLMHCLPFDYRGSTPARYFFQDGPVG